MIKNKEYDLTQDGSIEIKQKSGKMKIKVNKRWNQSISNQKEAEGMKKNVWEVQEGKVGSKLEKGKLW